MNINNILNSDNQLLKSFIIGKKGKILLETYFSQPTQENRKKLDEAFKCYYLKIRAISYFSKALRFEAIHYDKKRRVFNDRFPLTLDAPIDEDESVTRKDAIVDTSQNVNETEYQDLEELIEDNDIRNAILKLTEKQQEILIYIYVMNKQDIEVAEMLGVSQQSVSKNKRVALTKLRRELNV